jgi:hypothetical protein
MEKENNWTTSYFNARKLRINDIKGLIKGTGFEIDDITIDGQLVYDKGDAIPLTIYSEKSEYKTNYVLNRAFKVNKSTIEVNEFDISNTSLFILPLLGINKEQLLWDKIFINAYMDSYDYSTTIGECCHIIFRYMPFSFYNKYITDFIPKLPNYSSTKKDYLDSRFDRVTFVIPYNLRKDIDYIMENNFDKVSIEAKEFICNFHKIPKGVLDTLTNKKELIKKLKTDNITKLDYNITEFNLGDETWGVQIK